ncbi:cell division topological specificity factor [Pseudooceanicola antarcticus]|uniref:Cell division topological specificity factor n=1 Tax=Pseudooceanicola antarcticus TaxID=1247613 RepID=A0A285JFP9_9RHOB|nr:cell division topological specificity factor MinE [Pseudooceanicola antarcticus]SNY59075.1 cell division topological specificity factor [Pseudooceanicola antarcticus]
MSLFGFAFKPRRAKTAQTAKDRLQLLLAHERASGAPEVDFLPQLQADLLAVIRKYVTVDEKDVEVKMQGEDGMSCLEINVEMPARAKAEEKSRPKADAGTGAKANAKADTKAGAKPASAAKTAKAGGPKA